jgi:membrane protein
MAGPACNFGLATMPITVRAIFKLLHQTVLSWLDNYAPSMGAALAFYTLFSLAPLMLIVVSVGGMVFGEDAARGEIASQLAMLMGSGGALAVQDLLASVRQPQQGSLATAIGLSLLLLGATTVFAELQNALDRIWHAPASWSGGTWLTLVRTRLLSFGMILAIGFLLLVSLMFSAGLTLMGHWVEPMFGAWYAIAALSNALVAFAMVTAMFAVIYKVMPRVRVQWRDVWTGALFTSVLFSFGRFLIGLYIGRSGVVTAFGAAGSLVVILLWVYYSAQIFLLGAEFTWVYANTFGSRSLKRHLTDVSVSDSP